MNLVFDFGAVVFSWRPDEIVRGMFPEQVHSAEAARSLAADIFHHGDWQNFDRGTITQEDVIDRTARRLQLPHQAVQRLVAAIPDHLAPLPDTVDLLDQLRRRRDSRSDIRLYYLSNMPAPYARSLEQRHAFLSWFDGGMFSADVKAIKPHPDIFRQLEARYSLVASRTVFVDDLQANVEAARAHGWHAIPFESAIQLEPMLAAHIG